VPAVAATLMLPTYTAGLPAVRVDAALREALGACDRAQASAALWFAEVQRRGLHRALGFASLQLYATEALRFSDNRYWQFKRLADDLERLPALRRALARGEIGWTKAQLVARVATARTQERWVARARAAGRRELEQEVRAVGAAASRRRQAVRLAGRSAGAMGEIGVAAFSGAEAAGGAASAPPDAPAGNVAGPSLAGPQAGASTESLALAEVPPSPVPPLLPLCLPDVAPSTVTLRLDTLQLARLEALLERVRRLGLVPPGAERADIVLAGLEALVAGAGEDRAAALPAFQVVVQQCPDCGATSAVTGRGERRLAPAQVARVLCDARIREPGRANRSAIPPRVRAAVLTRDRHRCTTPGCGATWFLEVHHVTPRLRGGSNGVENLVTLCGRCHRFAHEQEQAMTEVAAEGSLRRTR
jgi:5-methylcytosine-specific restriction endonuclease McrA